MTGAATGHPHNGHYVTMALGTAAGHYIPCCDRDAGQLISDGPTRPGATATGDDAGGPTHGYGEQRSQAGAGPDNGASKSDPWPGDATVFNGGAEQVAHSGRVAPEVAPHTAECANSINQVAEVASSTGFDDAKPADPIPDPVPNMFATLLDEVVSIICKNVYFPREKMYAEVAALWIAGTHVFGSSDIFPRFVITSPEPGCGKSNLLKIMRFLCRNSVHSSRATEPGLLRIIKATKGRVVVLLDDAENFIEQEHTSLLNSGFDRYGGSFIRCQKNKRTGNFEAEEFNVYVPIAIARIGKTPVNSTRSRCLEINVQRAKPGEVPERFRPDLVEAKCEVLQKKLCLWAWASRAGLKGYDPVMPEELANRDADIWRFIIAVADLAGKRWGDVARKAAVSIALNTLPQGSSHEFRNAMHRALEMAHDPQRLASENLSAEKLGIDQIADGSLRLSSAGLCQLLGKASFRYNSLKQVKLAELLKPFDITPGQVKVGGKPLRGYKEEDLKDMLDRYGAGDDE